MRIILSKEFLAVALSVCMVFCLTMTQAMAQQPSGRIGFCLKVQADGFFNLKVTKIIVELVKP
jgi:hypothetical protein